MMYQIIVFVKMSLFLVCVRERDIKIQYNSYNDVSCSDLDSVCVFLTFNCTTNLPQI